MRIAMIGAGYVGLVSGACFADFGHHVVCVDKDVREDRRTRARRNSNLRTWPSISCAPMSNEERLQFTTALEEPVRSADAVFIAVGTPSRRW